MQITANGIKLEVEEHGAGSNPALILIRGLGTQLIHWPRELIEGFVAQGFRVITFDNRDIGKSARCPAPGVDGRAETILADLAADRPLRPAYSLNDMAQDVIGMMDALRIAKAHVFGISMGGAITQLLAIHHADRLLSATIVMTRAHFTASPGIEALLSQPQDRAGFIETALQGDRAWGSPGFGAPESYFCDLAGRAYDRGADPEGVNRQLLATLTSGDRRAALRDVGLPCFVIHGADDTLVPPEGGEEIAALIPRAELQIIAGMGHVITPKLAPLLVEKVSDFIARRAG